MPLTPAPLTRAEATRLEQIARDLRIADPYLAHCLSEPTGGRTALRLLAVLIAFMLVLSTGLALNAPALCGVASAILLVGLVLVGISTA